MENRNKFHNEITAKMYTWIITDDANQEITDAGNPVQKYVH